jgi:Leucine-rich repeat (LRR) protein
MQTLSMVTESGLLTLKHLILRDNMISSIPDKAFDLIHNLTYLDLAGNAITMISETTFSRKLLGQFDKLFVGNNPFSCSCDLLWFQKMLKTHHVKFYEDLEFYEDYSGRSLVPEFYSQNFTGKWDFRQRFFLFKCGQHQGGRVFDAPSGVPSAA